MLGETPHRDRSHHELAAMAGTARRPRRDGRPLRPAARRGRRRRRPCRRNLERRRRRRPRPRGQHRQLLVRHRGRTRGRTAGPLRHGDDGERRPRPRSECARPEAPARAFTPSPGVAGRGERRGPARGHRGGRRRRADRLARRDEGPAQGRARPHAVGAVRPRQRRRRRRKWLVRHPGVVREAHPGDLPARAPPQPRRRPLRWGPEPPHRSRSRASCGPGAPNRS